MTDFAVRHIGPTSADQQHMLGSLGYSSLDELTTAALPDGTPPAGLRLPDPLTETEALAELPAVRAEDGLVAVPPGASGFEDDLAKRRLRRTS